MYTFIHHCRFFNFDWICLESFLHSGESYGSPAADPVSTYNEVSQVSHQTTALPSTKRYFWSQKINNPFFRHLKVMGYPLRTRSQNTTTTTTTTTTSQQSKLLTAMAFPKGTLSQRRKLLQPQQVKHHDHNVYIILINTEIRKFCQQNSDEGLLQVMESLLKIQ